MDLVVAVLISVVSATCTGGLVIHNARQANEPPPRARRQTYAGKWQLPAPGVNLQLYDRVKTLLDELESERNEARCERDLAISECEELERRLTESESTLNTARDIVRAYTHPKMKIRPVRKKICIDV